MAPSYVKTAVFAHDAPNVVSPLSQSNLRGHSTNVNRESQPDSSTVGGNDIQRADSTTSQSHTLTPSRGGTLKKRQSLSRKNSLNRSASKKGSRPASVKSLAFADDVAGHGSEMHSAFFTPVPTSGSPTEILVNRFQGKLLESSSVANPLKDFAEMSLLRSMAEGTQRPGYLLSRYPKVLRFSV